MEQTVIVAQSLVKRFDNVVAVDNISFSVARSEICALLGGNGAGKTTTLSLLLGLLEPTAGQVYVLGEDMSRNRHNVLGRMNFSSPYVDLPQRLTVWENLSIYAHLYGVRDVGKRVKDLAGELDIEMLLKRVYRTLSAGQKTRVSLAKALLNRPEVLLLDEPTASLDPDSADRVRQYLLEYHRSSGATIFLASHNMLEVERVCSDVIVLGRGKIVDRGSPQRLISQFGRDTLEEVFLDIARGLVHEDRQAGTEQ